jgi:hypothetical protein
MQTPLPYRLQDGLLLEDSGTLLAWGAPLPSLSNLADPVVEEKSQSRHWTWRARQCLGGLRGDVSACRFLDAVNPRAYHLYLDHLHFAVFRLLDLSVPTDDHLRAEFRRIYEQLVCYFGEGHWSYPKYNSGLPAIFWEFAPLRIDFATMGRGHVAVSFTHEPSGYTELREEAAAISSRHGRGARVDYVAW